VPPNSVSSSARQDTDLLDNEDEGTTILPIIGKYLPVGMV